MDQFRIRLVDSLIILIWINSLILPQALKFNHLTVDDGLSNNDVNTLIQDQMGFIWFGTDDGLNRYDGYKFKIFRSNTLNPNSLSDNSIWSLMEDRNGNIWIGTKGGIVNKYDPQSEKFVKWKVNSKLTEENSITALYEDSEGKIWIGSYRDGVYKLDPSSGEMKHWNADPDNPGSLSHNFVKDIIEDPEGNILVATYIGLNKLHHTPSGDTFKRYYHSTADKNTLSNNLIWSFSRSSINRNIVWIGTADGLNSYNSLEDKFDQVIIENKGNLLYGNSVGDVIEETIDNETYLYVSSYTGLIKVNLKTGQTFRFSCIQDDEYGLIDNQINKIIRDRSGIIWIATENGISYLTPKSFSFNSLYSGNISSDISSALRKKNITALYRSPDGIIWIGTSEGLYSTNNLNVGTIKSYNQFRGTHIWSLCASKENNLWVGTYGKGLKEFNYKSGSITGRDIDDPKVKTYSLYYNKAIKIDRNNNVWVGYWGIGLSRIDPVTGKSVVWLNDPHNDKSLSYNDVWTIEEDRFGRIWIGTSGGGLNLFEEKGETIFHHWMDSEDTNKGLNSNNVYSICESAFHRNENETVLWVGTNNGLNQLSIKNRTNDIYNFDIEIKSFTTNDGLADNSINSIMEDNQGNLWLGTASGISRFEVSKKHFTNFTRADGLNGTVMNYDAACKDNNGLMLFGSTKGLNVFSPEKIKTSSFKPPVVITEFQIFNQPIPTGENSIIRKSINYTPEVILPYSSNVFSFEFSALDFNSTPSIKYSYKMQGFDKDWIDNGGRHFATYTNLNPGEYTFQIKATNSDGIWNQNYTSLSVIIEPPWWQTIWAIGIYGLILISGTWVMISFYHNRTKLQNEIRMRNFESKHLREIEKMKSRFFANISHEFRTPLTLIKGPLEQLINGKIKDNVDAYYKMIFRNTEKLENLIDQLLELSKLEAETIPLNKGNNDLVSLLKNFTYSFMPLAGQKAISLNFNSSVETLYIMIDKDKLEKVINNLLSNAFKFTPNGGNISVELSKEKESAVIIVSDTGIGIPEGEIQKIFNRFYKVNNLPGMNHGGSGIGLALVKELVSLNNWDISVQSREGKGSIFKLIIPLEVPDEKPLQSESSPQDTIQKFQDIQSNSASSKVKQRGKDIILFVEDSDDVRKYVFDLLSRDYKVLLASNGADGIASAIENMPDLIVSDVMMPGMDGIEFCRCIKNDWQTSHIPLILLTAKAAEESKLEGLGSGADDYLTKPFSFEELSTRIKNLIEQRKLLREKFSKEFFLQSGAVTENPVDNDFLKKALCSAEKNIHNPSFDSEQLAKELFVSRRQLHRKLVALTGHGPGEFLRLFRLKRAAQLLRENNFNITQISYEVGFESPSQFSRAFKKYYSCLPSDFVEKCHNHNE